MKLLLASDDPVHKALGFHVQALERVGYPDPFVETSVRRSLEEYCCLPLADSSFFFYRCCDRVDLPEFDHPTIQHLALVDPAENIAAELITGCLQEKLGDVVIALVESYNQPVLDLLDQLPSRKTYHCQKKLICRDIDKLCGEGKPPEGITIRTFIVGQDEQRYADFYNEVLGYLGSSYIDATFVRNIEARPSFSPEGYLLAETRDKCVGFVSIENAPWGREDSGFAYIFQIGVAEKWKGSGLASALLQRAASFGKEKGSVRIGVGVRDSNTAAINFFEGKGFVIKYDTRGYVIEVVSR